MIISMESAFYISSICSFFGLIFMVIYIFKKERQSSCPPCFVLFYLIAIIYGLMIAFRSQLGTFLSVIVSNTLWVIGIFSFYKGVSSIVRKKVNTRFILVVLLSFVLMYSVFTYIYNSVLIRIFIINIYSMFIVGKTIYTLQKSKVKFSLTDEFMSIVLILYLAVFLLRIIFNLIYIDNNSDFLSFTIDPIFVLIIGIINLMFFIGILSLYNNDFVSRFIESERRLRSLVSNLPGFAYRCLNDEYWTMKYVSDQFKKVTGYKPDDIVENNKISYEDLIIEGYKEEVRGKWEKSVIEKKLCILEYEIRKKDGSNAWVWEQGIPIYEADNSCNYLEGFIMDITQRKVMEKNLETLSYNDSLTGLHNRRYMENELQVVQKNKRLPITIIMGDINGLKFVNDTFGHNYGDDVLVYVANSIHKVIRDLRIISRISGDEFVIILEETDEQKANEIISLIQDEVSNNNPFEYEVSISLGSATTYDNNFKISEIQKNAEDNMYKQKIYAKPSNQRKTIDAVLKTLYEKDKLSEEHSQNISRYAKALAKKMDLKSYEVERVETAALLHDVGKIIISKEILTTPNKLTEYEYNEIKKHPEIGYRILNSVPELSEIAEIILYHHERIDGKGYPKGLKGEEIPLISKIISICDAYDAMVNTRLYRKPLSIKKAIKELLDNKGTQFDEKLVEIFVDNIDEITKE